MKTQLVIIRVIVGMVMCLFLLSAVTAQVLDSSPNQQSVVAEDRRKAENGDANAQLSLGHAYAFGRGVAKDDVEAVKWYRLAAEQGLAGAQNGLGIMYASGRGITRDYTEAMKWYRLAAEQKYVGAQYNLGSMYASGHGVAQDDAEAVRWYRLAAEQGNANAQFILGEAYELGQGVVKDESEAVKWYRLAAEQGNADAQYMLGVAYGLGQGVKKDDAQAVKWYRLAAEQGDADAQFILGITYASGEGVTEDNVEAMKWYRLAAEQGHMDAQNNLGTMYASGRGVTRDNAEAVRWYRLAAEQGDANAQYNLARLYWRGEGLPQNHIWAYSWAILASASGHAEAQKLREAVAAQMTREQIAEAQRLASAFKPKVSQPVKRQSEVPADQGVYSTGSGFFVTTDGYFVTNHHVISAAVRVRVRTAAGLFPATVVRADAANDIAILKVEGEFRPLPVRGSRGLKLADRVATLGYPNPDLQGQAAKYSSGEVAALSGLGDDPRLLQISVPIQPGNSGGPLVDVTGSVVGVIVSQLNKIATFEMTGNLPENVNYAIKGTFLLGVMEAVAGLTDKVRSEPAELPKDAAEIAKRLEDASGMVLVEK